MFALAATTAFLLALGLVGALLLARAPDLGSPSGTPTAYRMYRARGCRRVMGVRGEPNWNVWALWLALKLRVLVRRGATQQDWEAARRALDEFDAELRGYELRRWRDISGSPPG